MASPYQKAEVGTSHLLLRLRRILAIAHEQAGLTQNGSRPPRQASSLATALGFMRKVGQKRLLMASYGYEDFDQFLSFHSYEQRNFLGF
jgi:hypothetical protein